MLRITKEKLYLDEACLSREFLEKILNRNFDADFVCVDEEKSFKIKDSNQTALSKEECKHVKYLLKNKDKIISDYQESIRPPEPNLEELKTQKLSEAENYRKYLQFLPVKYSEANFSTSEMARQNILISLLTLDSSAKKYWRDNDNNSHDFGAENFKEIAALISKRDTKLYRIEAKIKSIISAAETTDSLISLTIQDLWTKTEKSCRQTKK